MNDLIVIHFLTTSYSFCSSFTKIEFQSENDNLYEIEASQNNFRKNQPTLSKYGFG